MLNKIIANIFSSNDGSPSEQNADDLLKLHSEILKNMTEGVYLIKTSDGQIVYANPRFEEMFGYEPGEMIGKNVSIVNAPSDKSPEKSAKEIMDILDATGEWHGEIKNIKKDGTEFWCMANVSKFKHSKYGEVLVSVHTDITGQKLAQQMKSRGEEKYKSLFMASRDAVMTIEAPNWAFTTANPATLTLFGAKSEAEFLSYEPWSLSPVTQPDGRSSAEKAKEMIDKAMVEGVNLFEWVHKRLNGEEFFAEVLLSRVQNGDVYLYASVRDITERKKNQFALEKFNQVMVGRELEMKKLKQENAELKDKIKII